MAKRHLKVKEKLLLCKQAQGNLIYGQSHCGMYNSSNECRNGLFGAWFKDALEHTEKNSLKYAIACWLTYWSRKF